MHDIDTALQVIRARDASAARLANGLWEAMRARAAHVSKVTRYDVQSLCWGALPVLARDPTAAMVVGSPHAAAHVLAELLMLLGYKDYAELCRSETTRRILDAAEDADRCAALARDAWRSSGVLPPNTPVISWGEVRGPIEQVVHGGCGRILEEAADAGVFDGAGKDLEQLRVGLVVKVLQSPAENLPGTWYLQVFHERLDSWVTYGGSQTRRELLVRVAPDVKRPPEPNPCLDLPAMHHLLQLCDGDGVRLTRNGYIPPALVAELAELMPCAADYPPARSESNSPPVSALRHLATKLDLVHQDGPRLRLTDGGRDRVGDSESLVMAVGNGMVVKDASVRGVIEEVIFAVLLLEESTEVDRVVDKVGIVIEEEGWEPTVPGPPSAELGMDYAEMYLDWLYVLDVVNTEPETSKRFGLTMAGRAAARWALRARVMLREVPGP